MTKRFKVKGHDDVVFEQVGMDKGNFVLKSDSGQYISVPAESAEEILPWSFQVSTTPLSRNGSSGELVVSLKERSPSVKIGSVVVFTAEKGDWRIGVVGRVNVKSRTAFPVDETLRVIPCISPEAPADAVADFE